MVSRYCNEVHQNKTLNNIKCQYDHCAEIKSRNKFIAQKHKFCSTKQPLTSSLHKTVKSQTTKKPQHALSKTR